MTSEVVLTPAGQDRPGIVPTAVADGFVLDRNPLDTAEPYRLGGRARREPVLVDGGKTVVFR